MAIMQATTSGTVIAGKCRKHQEKPKGIQLLSSVERKSLTGQHGSLAHARVINPLNLASRKLARTPDHGLALLIDSAAEAKRLGFCCGVGSNQRKLHLSTLSFVALLDVQNTEYPVSITTR